MNMVERLVLVETLQRMNESNRSAEEENYPPRDALRLRFEMPKS